jgi:pimeloyl-ACP methyl ester carboxylesterase/hypothetical membrane protein
LLTCGILSPVLYAISDAVAGLQWQGYSFRDQTISELGAIDAPSRPLFAALLLLVYALMVAFGVGIRKAADGDRRLRIAGGLVIALGVMALTVGQFASMRLRGTEQGIAGLLHLVEGAAAMLMIFTAMGVAAGAFGRRFRLYTIGTIILALGFGGWAVSEASRIEQGLATPWVGVKERIFWYGYQAWFIVLALALLRKESVRASRSPFKTPEGEGAFIAAYDDAMKLWPVPYEEIGIPTQFGTTHVVTSGPMNAPPLVLLHGYMATSAMWAPNIKDFSKDFRVYAIDVMGQPSKSIPGEPIADTADFVSWLTATLDAMRLDRVHLLGMSFGGWLALNYAVAAPQRVRKLILLSPGGLLPMVRQFTVRAMLMVALPTRLTVNSFFRWLGFADRIYATTLDLIYLGIKHFRMPLETARIAPAVVSDEALRKLQVPTLLLIGDQEVISDPTKALERARRLIPDFRGELVFGSRHEMSFSRSRIVDARVLEFLEKTRPKTDAAIVWGGYRRFHAFHSASDPLIRG